MNAPPPARRAAAQVDALFLDRWSPRAFSTDEISDGDLAIAFEAARWAPSCFNDQPWLFLYARNSEDRRRILDLLVPANRDWATAAPVLGMVLARRHFRHNGKPNRWAAYDAGAAAMSLALQAWRLGFGVHFMAGFDAESAPSALGFPADSWEPLAAFALGRPGDPASLPDTLRDREHPSGRKPPEEVAVEGRFPKRLREA